MKGLILKMNLGKLRYLAKSLTFSRLHLISNPKLRKSKVLRVHLRLWNDFDKFRTGLKEE